VAAKLDTLIFLLDRDDATSFVVFTGLELFAHTGTPKSLDLDSPFS
jgi:hypothetical protein